MEWAKFAPLVLARDLLRPRQVLGSSRVQYTYQFVGLNKQVMRRSRGNEGDTRTRVTECRH
jgi:hypothetical protein